MDWHSLTDRELLSLVGSRLRLARLERNLTQQMLAERAGLNRSTVRDLENGRSVTLLSLMQLLRSLELLERLDEWLPGSVQRPVLAKLQQERKRFKPSKKNS